jgi:hypothetical protein
MAVLDSRSLASGRGSSVRLRRRSAALALAAGLGLLAPIAGADEPPSVRRLGQDLFMVGDELRLEEEVPGDAVLIGSSIDVAAPVNGDGVIAGRELELRGPFRNDLYAAGARVRLDGSVAGNARIIGAEVSLGPDSTIDGGVSIGAARADIAGSVDGYLQVAAGNTTISGRVAGDLEVSGEQLQLAPSAQIDGSLVFTGPQPASVAPGARVNGEIRHVPSSDASDSGSWSAAGGVFAVISVLGLATVGVLLWTLWPRFTRSAIDAATKRSGRAFLTGLALAAGVPLIVVLLLVSIVGIPLAVFAGSAYLMLFPLGYLLAGATIAEQLVERFRSRRIGRTPRRLLALSLALLLLAMLAFVPMVGAFSIVALTLLGMGALVLAAFDTYRQERRVERSGPSDTGMERPAAEPAVSAPHLTRVDSLSQ